MMIDLDFRGAYRAAIEVSGYRARLLNAIRLLIGDRAMFALCRLLPLGKPCAKGLLIWTPDRMICHGQWAMGWHCEKYDAFFVGRAESDAQLRAWRNGGLTYDLGAWL